MTPAEQLRAAKALIDTPEKWTREAFARNAIGESCRPSEATCFCIVGALDNVDHDNPEYDDRAEEALRGLLPKGFYGSITAFNDAETTTHADIMKLFDDAIALAEASS